MVSDKLYQNTRRKANYAAGITLLSMLALVPVRECRTIKAVEKAMNADTITVMYDNPELGYIGYLYNEKLPDDVPLDAFTEQAFRERMRYINPGIENVQAGIPRYLRVPDIDGDGKVSNGSKH